MTAPAGNERVVLCRKCGQPLPPGEVAFGSTRTGWEHPFDCPTSTICGFCHPYTTYVCNITDQLVIGHQEGPPFGKRPWPTYVLLGEPCHRGDELITFDITPRPDPVPDDDDESEAAFENDPNLWAASEAWLQVAKDAMKPLNAIGINGAWRFVEDLRTGGYDPDSDGDVVFWLYDRIGRAVQTYETGDP